MTAAKGLDERFVVPRWRSFAATLAVGELADPRLPDAETDSTTDQDPLDVDLFADSPGLNLAGDLLGRTLHGVGTAAQAQPLVDYVLANPEASEELRRLAEAARAVAAGETLPTSATFQVVSGSNAGTMVHKARASLRRYPRNPVRWMDLALAQTTTGELAKARRSVQTALSLAPTNRFVLRAASRFFVHVDDPERAHNVVLAAARDMRDPWILAAEIAAAEIVGSSSRLIVPARRSLRAGDFAPAQASELACAIASHEFETGQEKSGRKLLAQALIQPTENAVAQAEFEARRGNFALPDDLLAHEGTFEARAITFGARAQWTDAVRYAKKWQQDQSFASDPATYLSYVASVCLEDYVDAAEAARIGLTANPSNALLANNYAFSLANLGRADEAAAVLDQYPASTFEGSEQAVRLATLGLIAFRQGDSARGRELYEASFVTATKSGLLDHAAFAAAYWACEETRLNSSIARSVLEVARVAVERSGGPDQALVLKRAEKAAYSADEVSRADPAALPRF